jgi:hypothetical protein
MVPAGRETSYATSQYCTVVFGKETLFGIHLFLSHQLQGRAQRQRPLDGSQRR